MRIDVKQFRKTICKQKCKRYYNGKLEIGKCVADTSNIYECAKRKMLAWGRKEEAAE